jgi:hypothetical protein
MPTRMGAPPVGQRAASGLGGTLWRRASAGMDRHNHQAERRERDGPARMEKAARPDLHKAIGPDVLEESAEQLPDVEVGSPWAGTARVTGSEGDGAVCEADEALVGDRDLEDRGGAGGEGAMAVVLGLTRDMPRDGPDLWIDVLQQSGLVHLFFEERTGDGGEGLDGDKAVALEGR